MTWILRAVVAAALLAGAASAQDDVQTPIGDLQRLAGLIGAAHQIAQLCDSNNQAWREQMLSLINVEARGDDAREHVLIEAFNAGFRDSEKKRRRCDAEARQAQADLAAEGRRLAESLRDRYLH
jgi:uncharacterized protein (TIGR02301 family)